MRVVVPATIYLNQHLLVTLYILVRTHSDWCGTQRGRSECFWDGHGTQVSEAQTWTFAPALGGGSLSPDGLEVGRRYAHSPYTLPHGGASKGEEAPKQEEREV